MSAHLSEAYALIDSKRGRTPATSAESFWQPDHVVDSGWLEHAPFGSWLFGALRPSLTVELGTHNGYSYFSFCENIRRLALPATIFAIDTWRGDDHAGFYGEDVFSMVSRINGEKYADFSTLLRGYFEDHRGSFTDGSIDLLHIDGRHGYEDVLEDFTSWAPKVAPGGIVIFHDITVREREFGVWQLWDEISSRYPSFRFDHGHGLGVAAIGGQVPENLRPLFEATDDEADRTRAFYANLGAIISEKHADDTARRVELATLQQQLAEERAALTGALQDAQQLRESHSWRATRPLRAVVDAVRHEPKAP